MQFFGRAYYNLLIMNPGACCDLDVKPWQCMDYRALDTNELLKMLEEEGVIIDLDGMEAIAKKYDSPEELLSSLLSDDDENFERVYLLIFEVWRRYCSEKQSLSIFCDELDQTVNKYHLEEIAPEELVDIISELERVLDDNFDQGVDPKEIFATICAHMAHDLESFLFDFITQQIGCRNEQYASELIEDFYPYVAHDHWFDFLRVRLTSLLDSEEASFMLSHLLDKLEEKKDKELLFEALEFLVSFGENASYLTVFTMLLNLVNTQDEYTDLVQITSKYFSRYALDCEELEKMEKKVSRRKKTTSISSKDRDQLREITLTGLKLR